MISVLALGLSGSQFPDWWGNTVVNDNLDANGLAVTLTLPDDGTSYFGPSSWS